MTAIDPGRPEVIPIDVPDRSLLTLDALADAATRLPDVHAQHHLAQLGRLLPDGRVERLPLDTAEVIATIETNQSWVMLQSLATLPEYRPLMRRVGAPHQLALRTAATTPTANDLIAFVGSPGASVPFHYDVNHHLLVQIEGTKRVAVGAFDDPNERDRQLARGLMDHRLNVDREPDHVLEFELRAGDALVLPAFAFHAVEGGGEVSIALTYMVATADTERTRDRYKLMARTA
jgi:hypothetical protein